jgi:peptidylprolyl isomerase
MHTRARRPDGGLVARGGRWLLLAVALGFLFVACGGDDDAGATGLGIGDDPPTNGAMTETPPPPADPSAGAGGVGEEGLVAQNGDTVSVHYRGTLDDGTEFDSSAGRDPLTFTVGGGQVIAGFDTAVLGMTVGEKKEVRLAPDEAYGERTDERVIQVPRDQAPEGLEAGQQVLLGQAPATVLEVTDESVTVDANHPLAGQALTFEIELVAIQ